MDNTETESNGTVSSIVRACVTSEQNYIIIGLFKIPKAFIELTLEGSIT